MTDPTADDGQPDPLAERAARLASKAPKTQHRWRSGAEASLPADTVTEDELLRHVGKTRKPATESRPAPDTPKRRARGADPHTSKLAARAIDAQGRSEVKRRIMLCYAKHGPMHDLKLVDVYRDNFGPNATPSGLRTARRGLADEGLVVDTGQVIRTENNRDAIVWHRTDYVERGVE
jgi:hypothetical protein